MLIEFIYTPLRFLSCDNAEILIFVKNQIIEIYESY